MRMIFRLPGERAKRISADAAFVWVQFWGGNMHLAEALLANHNAQEELSVTDPDNPLRMLGEEADALSRRGPGNAQLVDHLQKLARKTYRPEDMSADHHQEKNFNNGIFVEGLQMAFGGASKMPRAVLLLDDFDEHGMPRSTKALLDAGIRPERVYVPNHENEMVVSKCHEMGVKAVGKKLWIALEQDWRDVTFSAAYLDGMCCNNDSLFGMIDTVLDRAKYAEPFMLGCTLIGRNFTEGHSVKLPVRLLHLWEYVRSRDFVPLQRSWTHACRVYRSTKGTEVATCFFVRKAHGEGSMVEA
jgi:hypothetical protein